MSKGRLIAQGLFNSFAGLVCLVAAAFNAYHHPDLFWLVILLLFGISNLMMGVGQLMVAAEQKS